MDSHQITTHVKHLLIAAGALIVVFLAIRAYTDMRVKLATITTTSAEKIKANEETEKKATGTIQQAQQSNVAVDVETARKLATVEQQLKQKLDTTQAKTLVQSMLPGVTTVEAKDAEGKPVIAIADTQENRDKLNQADAAFKTCRFNLEDCQQHAKNNQIIMDQQSVIILAKQQTIDAQKDTIKELTRWGKGGNFWARTGRVWIPAGCGAAGAGLAASGGVKPKGVALAGLASAGICSISFRF